MTQPPTGTARPVRRLRLGHSPDSDDAFMFYALASGAVSHANVQFDTVHRDIQTLNRLALHGELEITALSAHAYAHVWRHYALFTHGASMGQTVRPGRRRAGAAGTRRPAWATYRHPRLPHQCLPRLAPALGDASSRCSCPSTGLWRPSLPMKCPPACSSTKASSRTAQLGLHPVCDLGVWWHEETGLPLPLGVNAIRRDLGPELLAQASAPAQGEHPVRPRPPRRGAILRDGVRRRRAARPHRPVRGDVRQRTSPWISARPAAPAWSCSSSAATRPASSPTCRR